MKNYKTFLPVLFALLVTTTALGQPTQDSSKLWIKRADALRVLAAADSGRIYRDISISLYKDRDSLLKQMALKDQRIDMFGAQVRDYQTVNNLLQQQQQALTQQKGLMLDQIAKLNKQNRRIRNGKSFWKIISLLTLGGGVYLGTKL